MVATESRQRSRHEAHGCGAQVVGMDEIHWATADDLAASYRLRESTPRQVCEHLIAPAEVREVEMPAWQPLLDQWPLLVAAEAAATHARLPASLQPIGRPCQEELLCRIARAYERKIEWHQEDP